MAGIERGKAAVEVLGLCAKKKIAVERTRMISNPTVIR